ncbi:hypothetical protein AC068_08565 [Morganella morganii]|nr:hypothetical protein AC068_08565 [Morganella morganii]
MDTFVIQRISLPPQNPEKFRKTLSRIPLCHRLQRNNNRFITRGIRTIMVNYSAQIQTPAGLTDTEEVNIG